MNVTFQILTIISLIAFITVEITTKANSDECKGSAPWVVYALRTGYSNDVTRKAFSLCKWKTYIPLFEGCYYIGNRIINDIAVKASGPEVQLYLNVQKDHLYVSVIKGQVVIGNIHYEADKTVRINLLEHQTIYLNDIELKFKREVYV